MHIGKVVGNVVATRKDERLVGHKLLIVQPLSVCRGSIRPAGDTLVAIDAVGAGIGEMVVYVCGTPALRVAGSSGAPVDAAIVGIVDCVEAPAPPEE